MGSKIENHLSRLAMPKSWHIMKKGIKWVTRPKPGAHTFRLGMPLNVIMRDVIGLVQTTKEVKKILQDQEILIDGKRKRDHRLIVGFMDVISIPKIKKHFRIILTKKGKIAALEIKDAEAKIKPCRIKGKSQIKGKIQLNLFDGKNILVDKGEYKVGDSVLLELPKQKITETFKLEKGATVFLIGGKHIGETGTLEDIKKNIIVYKKKDETAETLKKYAFVIGKGKSSITIEK